MTENYRHFIKLVREQVKKFQVLQNAKGNIKSTTEKLQNNFSTAQNIVERYNNIIGKRHNEIMQDLNAKALKTNTPLPENIVKWWHWYNRLTGLDSVEMSKRQVLDLQNTIFECQEKRRTLNKNITDITHTLQRIYREMLQINRDDPKYVDLTIMENKNLQEQKKSINQLALLDVEEKDNFLQLVTAIKEYHDGQNLNATKFKYLSILASTLIAIISLIGSLILNNRRILDVRNTITTMQDTITTMQEKNEALFQTNTNQWSSVLEAVQSIESTLSQTPANKDKRKEDKSDQNASHVASNTSNIIVRSAMYPVNLLISGASYTTKGIYAGGSYVVKFFY